MLITFRTLRVNRACIREYWSSLVRFWLLWRFSFRLSFEKNRTAQQEKTTTQLTMHLIMSTANVDLKHSFQQEHISTQFLFNFNLTSITAMVEMFLSTRSEERVLFPKLYQTSSYIFIGSCWLLGIIELKTFLVHKTKNRPNLYYKHFTYLTVSCWWFTEILKRIHILLSYHHWGDNYSNKHMDHAKQ